MAIACELEFPEEIIHHIQSHMDLTEAVRTSVLSKSWHAACSTRPVLTFVEKDFTLHTRKSFAAQPFFSRVAKDKFIDLVAKANFFDVVGKTLHVYERLNLKPDKFVLTMNVRFQYRDTYTYIVSELIKRVSKLGVNEIDLASVPFSVLPPQVFTATSLKKLSVKFSTIDKLIDGGVLCARLVSLNLQQCYVCDSMLRVILSSCPLIEYLNLDNCYNLRNVNICKLEKLVNLRITSSDTGLISLDIGGGSVTSTVNYSNVRVLRLDRVRVDDEFFSKFSKRFPCVEDLVLRHCRGPGLEDIHISSHSVKYLTLDLDRDHVLTKLHLDVPNICKFSFDFSIQQCVPSLSVSTTSREWISDLNVRVVETFDLSRFVETFDLRPDWLFPKLRKLLKELSRSTVTLHFKCSDHWHQDFPYFITAVVENVIVHVYVSVDMSPHQFGDLCRFFRPIMMTRNLMGSDQVGQSCHYKRKKNLLCSGLMQILFGVHGLEEVTLELFEETVSDWRTVPLKELIDGRNAAYTGKLARLRLRWRQDHKRKERTDFVSSFRYLDVFTWFSHPWE